MNPLTNLEGVCVCVCVYVMCVCVCVLGVEITPESMYIVICST